MPKFDESVAEWIKVQSELNRLYVHDFKNPISAMTANISYLKSAVGDSDEDLTEAVEDLTLASSMLLHMVNNFLLISRLEAGEHLEVGKTPLSGFISGIVGNCKRLGGYEDIGIVVSGEVPGDICHWEIKYVQLAVENLILASVHNSPSQGSVVVSAKVQDGFVLIGVRDSGWAIGDEFVEHQFERDFQLTAKSNQEARYGRAMGMYAVGLAVDFLGGRVSVKDVDGQTQFEISVPVNANS